MTEGGGGGRGWGGRRGVTGGLDCCHRRFELHLRIEVSPQTAVDMRTYFLQPFGDRQCE